MTKIGHWRMILASKVRIKLGAMEVEAEGTEDFLKKEVPVFLDVMGKLYRENGLTDHSAKDSGDMRDNGASGRLHETPGLSVGEIAAKTKASSGAKLILAAAASLTLGKKKARFSREELNTEIKDAAHHYKQSYTNNLTTYLNTLVRQGFLVNVAKDTYALSNSERKRLEDDLAS